MLERELDVIAVLEILFSTSKLVFERRYGPGVRDHGFGRSAFDSRLAR